MPGITPVTSMTAGSRSTTTLPRERCAPSIWDGRISLFAGSDDDGQRAAAIYTLTGSARLNGLDPKLYLRHVLEHIADHPITRIDELLPWNLTRDDLDILDARHDSTAAPYQVVR
jgi:transposase